MSSIDWRDVLTELLGIVETKQAAGGGAFFVTYKELGAPFNLKPRYSELYSPLGQIVALCAKEGLPILPSVVVNEDKLWFYQFSYV